MPIELTSISAGVYPAQRAWLLDAVFPPQPEAARNSGREPDAMCREFVASLWESALAGLPALFERLVFLGGLRDPDTGYRHYGLELPVGSYAAEIMQDSHERAFRTWIAFTVEQQKADLELYLATTHGHRNDALKRLGDTDFRDNLIPASADAHERELYLTDFEALVHMLGVQRGFATTALDLAEDKA
ncbi:MAG TPA: hypothetical protein VN428_05390 [Bryobacteraceae bacterium]|nr:hypothetical protein [Bryobacteraceae bacterium]